MQARILIVTGVLLSQVGCRSEPAHNDLPPVTARADTAQPIEPAVPIPPRSVSPPASLVGTWTLDRDPKPTSPTSMRLELRIDSLISDEAFGGLVRYFAGNVGSDASDFPEFRGRVFGDSTFTISMWPTGMPNAGFTLAGHQGTDTLNLDTVVVGPDTLTGNVVRWMLIRTPR